MCHARLTPEGEAALAPGLYRDHCAKRCQTRYTFLELTRRLYGFVLTVRTRVHQPEAPAIVLLDRAPADSIGLDEVFGQQRSPHLFGVCDNALPDVKQLYFYFGGSNRSYVRKVGDQHIDLSLKGTIRQNVQQHILNHSLAITEWLASRDMPLECGEAVRKQLLAKLLHCVGTVCIPRTQRPEYSPKNTCHLTGCTAKQQSPHENDETAFNLVLHCPYEQTTQPCKVRLLRVFQCPWLRSWRRR